MIVLNELKLSPLLQGPYILALGNFDGVHLGHQKILNYMKSLAGNSGTTCIITFSNHPLHVLSKKKPIPLILSKSLKLKYLSKFGVNLVYCLEFTSDFSKTPYDVFLTKVKKVYPFTHLILGEGASLGHKLEGTPEKVALLGKDLYYQVEFLPKFQKDHIVISSNLIRQCIQKGEIEKAELYMGHPYILEGVLEKGRIQISPNLCLPPEKNYLVTLSNQF